MNSRRLRGLLTFILTFSVMTFANAIIIGFFVQDQGIKSIARDVSPEHPRACMFGILLADLLVIGFYIGLFTWSLRFILTK